MTLPDQHRHLARRNADDLMADEAGDIQAITGSSCGRGRDLLADRYQKRQPGSANFIGGGVRRREVFQREQQNVARTEFD